MYLCQWTTVAVYCNTKVQSTSSIHNKNITLGMLDQRCHCIRFCQLIISNWQAAASISIPIFLALPDQRHLDINYGAIR